MTAMLDFYRTRMRLAILEQFQYPVANYFYMIGMIAEPIIYLVVWSTIARTQGGQVGEHCRNLGADVEVRAGLALELHVDPARPAVQGTHDPVVGEDRRAGRPSLRIREIADVPVSGAVHDVVP